ncbi:MAG: endo-1,4-beta-xylanase [bacterium]
MKKQRIFARISFLIVFILSISTVSMASTNDLPSLHDLYEDYFPIGTAVAVAQWNRTLDSHRDLIESNFNSLTAENAMKPDGLQRGEGRFNFKTANELVDFAEDNDKMVRGHTLVWHSQTPDWFWKDEDGNRIDEKDNISEKDRQLLIDRMEDHIERVVSEYKGQIYAWDVVNEAISDSSSVVYRQDSPWYRILGKEFIKIAFEKAHEVDPEAKLFYNDYGAANPNKRNRIIELLEYLLENDVPIDGMGIQSHWDVDSPSIEDIEKAIQMYADLGLEIHITELDIGMEGFTEEEQAERYGEIFELFKKYSDVITNVTLWGVADDATWRPDQNPLLFNKDHDPKPAFWAVVDPAKPWYVNMAEYTGAATFKNTTGEEIDVLETGDYHIDELEFALEDINELELVRDHLITFYESKDFQGKTWEFTSTDDFNGAEMVNKAESFSIEHVEFENLSHNKEVETNVAADKAERAVDGDDNSSWSPNDEAPYWLSIDLGEAHFLNRWVVRSFGTGSLAGDSSEGPFNIADFKLQISDDGDSWHDLDEVEGNEHSFTDRDIDLTVARYVRLYVSRPTSLDFNQKLTLYEFEVYGTPVE